MGKVLKIRAGGITIDADLSEATFILAEPMADGKNIRELNVNISESVKEHPCFSYTTDLKTANLIFQNMTFRSSSLSYAKLNDMMEKERVGVRQFAGNRFITCFCHSEQESVPFWCNYGNDLREEKVLLRFRNFAKKFDACFHTDYGIVADSKKCLFKNAEYGRLINKQCEPGNTIADEYDLRAAVDAILMFDVEYIPADSDVFMEKNDGDSSIDFCQVTGQDNSSVIMHGFDPTVLGKQKSIPWEYEKETRILCSLGGDAFGKWDYIDLRLKPEIFRGLIIILSPWDDGNLRSKMQKVIESSSLPEDIKESIQIRDSVLKGTLNL